MSGVIDGAWDSGVSMVRTFRASDGRIRTVLIPVCVEGLDLERLDHDILDGHGNEFVLHLARYLKTNKVFSSSSNPQEPDTKTQKQPQPELLRDNSRKMDVRHTAKAAMPPPETDGRRSNPGSHGAASLDTDSTHRTGTYKVLDNAAQMPATLCPPSDDHVFYRPDCLRSVSVQTSDGKYNNTYGDKAHEERPVIGMHSHAPYEHLPGPSRFVNHFWFLHCKGGRPQRIPTTIDTTSPVSLLNKTNAKSLGWPGSLSGEGVHRITGIGKGVIYSLGYFKTTASFLTSRRSFENLFLVVEDDDMPDDCEVLFGWMVCCYARLVTLETS